jgi:hypothetical protein
MPEPSGAVADPKPGSESCRSLTPSRLIALCAAGLAGGVVVGAGLGLVGALIGAATNREMVTDPSGGLHVLLFGTVGIALGLPLGVAMGLRAAGRKLGIRGRFWPAAGASFAGNLASFGLAVFLLHLMSRSYMSVAHHFLPFLLFLFYAAPLVLSLVGGLAGYLLSRRRRLRWLAPVYLILALAGAGALLLVRARSESLKPHVYALPALLQYPNATTEDVSTVSGAETGTWYGFATDDSSAQVVGFYEKALAGWEKVPSRARNAVPYDMRDSITVLARDTKDGRQSATVRVVLNQHSGKTHFSVLYSRKH